MTNEEKIQLRLPLLHQCGINRNKNMKINFWKKIGNMNDLEFYRKYQEDALFLKAIFEMFLKCNGRWKENYIEIIGTEFHRYGNWDLYDEYIKFNDDVFKCYILMSENQLTTCYFEFSDFQNWQESRKKK